MSLASFLGCCTLLLNLLSISYLPSTEEYKQAWICKNSPEAVGQIFQQFDIPVEMFYKTLEDYHIKFTFDTAHIEPFVLKDTTHSIELISIESITDRLAWEDDWTQVYIPVHPLRPHHLWIVLKESKKSFLDMTREDALHLHSTTLKIINALYHRFGLSQYVIAQYNHPQDGQIDNHTTVELIPQRSNTKYFDLLDVMDCTGYIIQRNELQGLELPHFSDEEIISFKLQWNEALNNIPIMPIELPKKEQGIQINKHKKRLITQMST